MAVAQLRLQNLRCLASAELALHPRLNVIIGDNGAGKTSLLEAVYLLSRGRSFRTRHTEQLIRSGAAAFAVAGDVRSGPWSPVPAKIGGEEEGHSERRLSVQCDKHSGVAATIGGRPVESFAELAALLPVQVIDPGIHRLIAEGPTMRRRWLDWAMFHVEPTFLALWRGYRLALRQRNAALRTGTNASLWDGELQRFGEPLTTARSALVAALQPIWAEVVRALDAVPATLHFQRGWGTASLAESLVRQTALDRERGLTTSGPHRFDVALKVDRHLARDTVSRGQQKLLGAAMALSMSRLLAEHLGSPPVLLLDDPAAELDETHTHALLRVAAAFGGQRIMTALRLEHTPLGPPDVMFHVEQGGVKQL